MKNKNLNNKKRYHHTKEDSSSHIFNNTNYYVTKYNKFSHQEIIEHFTNNDGLFHNLVYSSRIHLIELCLEKLKKAYKNNIYNKAYLDIINSPNSKGNTPIIHIILKANTQTGKFATFELLFESLPYSEKINYFKETFEEGRNILHCIILGMGLDHDVYTKSNVLHSIKTLKYLYFFAQKKKCTELLSNLVNQKDNQGKTPLEYIPHFNKTIPNDIELFIENVIEEAITKKNKPKPEQNNIKKEGDNKKDGKDTPLTLHNNNDLTQYNEDSEDSLSNTNTVSIDHIDKNNNSEPLTTYHEYYYKYQQYEQYGIDINKDIEYLDYNQSSTNSTYIRNDLDTTNTANKSDNDKKRKREPEICKLCKRPIKPSDKPYKINYNGYKSNTDNLHMENTGGFIKYIENQRNNTSKKIFTIVFP